MDRFSSLFGGLPYDVASVGYFRLLFYLLLLLLGDCAGGVPAARLLLKPQSFVLLRAGWRRWFWMVLSRCFASVLALCLLLLPIGLLRAPTWETVRAWLLFTLHMEMLAAVQVLLIALYQNAMVAAVSVSFVQLASLFLSSRLPGALPLLLPGNWGALARTAEFGARQDSFPLWAAAVLNAVVLLLITLFGWCFVRRNFYDQRRSGAH